MRDEIAEILPYLFVSSFKAACNSAGLQQLGISCILNVMESARVHDDSVFSRHHIPLSDFGDGNLSDVVNRCTAIIEDARNSSGKVLLHCGRGQNRSPSVATGYLLLRQDMSLAEAFEHVRTRRPEFAPHEAYLSQLQEMEREIRGSVSLTESEVPLSVQEMIRRIKCDLESGS